jgi:AcrR family transcriptional regulator
MTARPERVAADEVRQRMLDAGRELALESGAALTIEHLRMEEVIQRARVPRSSVYRLWPYKDDYIDDLLCFIAGPGSWFSERAAFDPETFVTVTRLLAAHEDLLATMAGRRALLREIVRVTVGRNYSALTEDAAWRLHSALAATLGSTRGTEARKKIAVALEETQSLTRDTLVGQFRYLVETLGLRLRDPARTVEHFQMASSMLVQSLAMRNAQVQAAVGDTKEGAQVDDLLNTQLPGPGLDGEPAEWTLAAFAYLGVLDAFIELDPGFTPPADAGAT